MWVIGAWGSGVSSVLRTAREAGYTTVDGASPSSLQNLSLPKNAVIGLRLDKPTLEAADTLLKAIEASSQPTLLLTAQPSVLVGRLSSTLSASDPRQALLGNQTDWLELLQNQQTSVSCLKNMADYHIDTTDLSDVALKAKVARVLQLPTQPAVPLTVVVESFGFKRGLPVDANWVVDVRFLKNPFYDPELKAKTGLDTAVQEYVMAFPLAQQLTASLEALLPGILQAAQQEGRGRFKLAIGCTGGKHRSVTLAEHLHKFLQKQSLPDITITLNHRERVYWESNSLVVSR